MSVGADPAFATQRRLLFITGASRSGTTLLSFVLRNQREVFGLKELQFFGEVWDPHAVSERFTRTQAVAAAAALFARQELGMLATGGNAAQRQAAGDLVDGLGQAASDPAAVFAAVVHSLAQSAGKSIPCEQTPRNIFYARELLQLYPAARIVHMVRDPRAVMASQKMRWRRRHLAANGQALPRLQSLRAWANYHPYTVARLWSQATRAALALAAEPRVTLVRFEDLVQQPEATVRGLCDRLGLEYEAAMLDVGQVNSSHQSSAGGARRGLHATAIDKWREVLTPTEVAITERGCGALMRRFGYAPGSAAATSLPGEMGQRLSYLLHLGGVVLVNPRRAYVQAKALLRSPARQQQGAMTASGVAAHRDPRK